MARRHDGEQRAGGRNDGAQQDGAAGAILMPHQGDVGDWNEKPGATGRSARWSEYAGAVLVVRSSAVLGDEVGGGGVVVGGCAVVGR